VLQEWNECVRMCLKRPQTEISADSVTCSRTVTLFWKAMCCSKTWCRSWSASTESHVGTPLEVFKAIGSASHTRPCSPATESSSTPHQASAGVCGQKGTDEYVLTRTRADKGDLITRGTKISHVSYKLERPVWKGVSVEALQDAEYKVFSRENHSNLYSRAMVHPQY
jgi:hypothetical protein